MFLSIGKQKNCILTFSNSIESFEKFNILYENLCLKSKFKIISYRNYMKDTIIINLKNVGIRIYKDIGDNYMLPLSRSYNKKYSFIINPGEIKYCEHYFPNKKTRDNAYEIIKKDLIDFDRTFINNNQIEFDF